MKIFSWVLPNQAAPPAQSSSSTQPIEGKTEGLDDDEKKQEEEEEELQKKKEKLAKRKKEEEEKAAKKKKMLQKLGCVINTFGANHNAELLEAISAFWNGNGMYSFIDKADKIAESFGECLGMIRF